MKKNLSFPSDLFETILNSMKQYPLTAFKAPPGFGKSTYLPVALLRSPEMQGKKICILEPRRLAAKKSFERVRELLGDSESKLVGYTIKRESKVTKETRLEFVTEGILNRRIIRDPELLGVDMVILDEFHERNLQTDLALHFLLEIQETLRPDLKLLLMSATFDPEEWKEKLGANCLEIDTARFPMETIYTEWHNNPPDWNDASRKLSDILKKETGDVLVFLPGEREIHNLKKLLVEKESEWEREISCLYSRASEMEIQKAFQSPSAHRKIILSTNIAETSVTIPGVTVVVDFGLARYSVYQANSGESQLITREISKEEADQRKGRAGRLGPGKVYRFWSQREEKLRKTKRTPEILQSDLKDLVYFAKWMGTDWKDWKGLDKPSTILWKEAEDFLIYLAVLNSERKITDTGKSLLKHPTNLRLARMVEWGLEQGESKTTLLDIADIVSEPGLWKRVIGENPSIHSILHWNSQWIRSGKSIPLHRSVAYYLSVAYPDRIANRRKDSRNQFKTIRGKGAILSGGDVSFSSEWILILDSDGSNEQWKIRQAIEIPFEEVKEIFQRQEFLKLRTVQKNTIFESNKMSWKIQETTKVGEITLQEKERLPTQDERWELLRAKIQKEGLDFLDISFAQKNFLARLEILWRYKPVVSGIRGREDIECTLQERLLENSKFKESILDSIRVFGDEWKQLTDLKAYPWDRIFLNVLGVDSLSLERYLPSTWDLPNGKKVKINYETNPPTISAKLQDLFGLTETPTLLERKITLRVEVLSPAMRPLQITQDMASFWKNTYPEIKKELKGRYPKHRWDIPEN